MWEFGWSQINLFHSGSGIGNVRVTSAVFDPPVFITSPDVPAEDIKLKSSLLIWRAPFQRIQTSPFMVEAGTVLDRIMFEEFDFNTETGTYRDRALLLYLHGYPYWFTMKRPDQDSQQWLSTWSASGFTAMEIGVNLLGRLSSITGWGDFEIQIVSDKVGPV